jgi:hypothetical protein
VTLYRQHHSAATPGTEVIFRLMQHAVVLGLAAITLAALFII